MARVLASSDLPTPVGPLKMKEAIGLFGFLRPAQHKYESAVWFWHQANCEEHDTCTVVLFGDMRMLLAGTSHSLPKIKHCIAYLLPIELNKHDGCII